MFGKQFSYLEVLYLRNNFLVDIPKEVSKLSQLIHIDMSDNEIMQIPSSSFQASTLLSSIILKRNKLKEISDYAFQGLLRLPHLDLSAQDLQIIGNYGFVTLSDLLSLDLSFNKQKVVKAEWFIPLNKLMYLYLNDNDILMIDPLLFNIMLKLRSVHTSQSALCCLTTKQLLCVVDSVETEPVCDRAITSTTVRIIAMLLGGTIIISNVLVIYLRLISNKTNVNSITIANLAISDTIQGVSIVTVITNDLFYKCSIWFNQMGLEKEFTLFSRLVSFSFSFWHVSKFYHFNRLG